MDMDDAIIENKEECSSETRCASAQKLVLT